MTPVKLCHNLAKESWHLAAVNSHLTHTQRYKSWETQRELPHIGSCTKPSTNLAVLARLLEVSR